MRYKLSNEAKMDLAHIYWRGVEEFGARQAERYYETLIQRFGCCYQQFLFAPIPILSP